MKSTIDFYDDTAQSWADRWYNIETFLPYLKQFMDVLPPNPTVAELCCGTGYDSMRLKNLGATVIGIDLSRGALKIARERNPGIRFYVHDILQDYSFIGKVDGILCCAGLIHINNDELPVAFRQMGKILNNHGSLFCVVYDGTGLREDWKYITINGVVYQRLFYRHTLDELKIASNGLFSFVREFEHEPEDKWRYYLFEKSHTTMLKGNQ